MASFQRCCDGQMTFSHGPWAPTTYLGLRPRRKDAAAEPVRGQNVWSPTFICGLLTPPPPRVEGGGAFGGGEVMRVESPGWDSCPCNSDPESPRPSFRGGRSAKRRCRLWTRKRPHQTLSLWSPGSWAPASSREGKKRLVYNQPRLRGCSFSLDGQRRRL